MDSLSCELLMSTSAHPSINSVFETGSGGPADAMLGML